MSSMTNSPTGQAHFDYLTSALYLAMDYMDYMRAGKNRPVVRGTTILLASSTCSSGLPIAVHVIHGFRVATCLATVATVTAKSNRVVPVPAMVLTLGSLSSAFGDGAPSSGLLDLTSGGVCCQ